MVVPLPPAE